MQFQILTLIALSAASVNAGCFSGGQSGTAANVDPMLGSICSGLIGQFVKGEQRHQCVTDSAQDQWDFSLKYIGGDGTRSIAVDECVNGFTKETSCSHGGSSSYANWEYTADPNSGSC